MAPPASGVIRAPAAGEPSTLDHLLDAAPAGPSC